MILLTYKHWFSNNAAHGTCYTLLGADGLPDGISRIKYDWFDNDLRGTDLLYRSERLTVKSQSYQDIVCSGARFGELTSFTAYTPGLRGDTGTCETSIDARHMGIRDTTNFGFDFIEAAREEWHW